MPIIINQKGGVWTINGKLYAELPEADKPVIDKLLKSLNLEKELKTNN